MALGKSNVDARRSMATNKKLAEEWTKKCSLRIHAEQPKIEEKTVRAHRKNACQQAGVCVCSRNNPSKGPRSWQLCDRLCRRLKELCPKVEKRSSPRRVLLEQRRLVLAFQEICAESPAALIFVHVGYINFSTWHFACQLLHRASDLDFCSPFLRPGVLQLRVQTPALCNQTLDVFSDLQFIQTFLDLGKQWGVQLYEISENDTDWLNHEHWPEAVPVCAVPEVGAFTVWRGGDEGGPAARRRASTPPKPRPRSSAHSASASLADRQASAPGHLDRGENADAALISSALYADEAAESDDPEEEMDSVDALAEQSADAGVSGLLLGADDEDEDPWHDVSELLLPAETAMPGPLEPGPLPDNRGNDAGVQEEVQAEAPGPAAAAPADTDAARVRVRAAFHRDPDASEEFQLEGLGCLRYYARSQKLVAVCMRPGHHDCRIGRVTYASEFTTNKFRGQGRPLGRLVSWLQQQNHEGLPDAQRHIHSSSATWEVRQAARTYFENLPKGREFAEKVERRQRAGEPAEPEHIR